MSAKREAFVRLATTRTKSVIDKIRVLSNCANSYAYEYNDEDVKKIFSIIEQELRAAKQKFEKQDKKPFTLDI